MIEPYARYGTSQELQIRCFIFIFNSKLFCIEIFYIQEWTVIKVYMHVESVISEGFSWNAHTFPCQRTSYPGYGWLPSAAWPSFFALPVTSLLSIFDPIHFSSVPVTAAALEYHRCLFFVLPFFQCWQWREEEQLALFSLINTESVSCLVGQERRRERTDKTRGDQSSLFLPGCFAFVSPLQ